MAQAQTPRFSLTVRDISADEKQYLLSIIQNYTSGNGITLFEKDRRIRAPIPYWRP